MRHGTLVRWTLAATVAALGVAPGEALAQATGAVRGTVLDSASQRPVAGVQVVIANSTLGSLTDASGRYLVAGVPAGSATLQFRRVGYGPGSRTVTIAAGDTVTADVSIAAVAAQLSEVVVVGYGTTNRAGVSTAIASVDAAEIVNTPTASLDAALQGKAPGVQVIQNAGNPGNGITVRIRGSASLSASNQPLYVIDGVPMLRENFSQLGLGGQDLTAVSGLSPDEIESIDVLKDAAAASIYGSRGSNGVVLITTKRGRAGEARFSFNAYTGTQQVERRVDMLNAEQYVAYFNEARANDGRGPLFEPGVDDAINTNWQDAIFRSAPVSDLALSASGGTERVRYFLSGSMFDQQGVVIGSGYNRMSGRVNVDVNATDRLSLRSSLSFSREIHDRIENDNTIDGVVTNALANQPNVPIMAENGEYAGRAEGLEYSNSVALAELNSIEARTLRTLGSLEADYELTSALRLSGRVGMDVLNLRDLRWESPRVSATYAASVNGVSSMGNNTASRYMAEGFLTYTLPASERHALTLTGGSSVEFSDRESDYLRGEGFGNEAFRYPGNAGTVTEYDGGSTEYNLVSFFGRATYAFNERYFLTGSFRADGSSRFGQENRFGYFPAISAAWAVTEEDFLSASNIGDLKLRASYGFTGNQDIGDDYAFLPRFGRANYADEPGIAQSSLGNPNLKWESTQEANVGLDWGFFDGRMTFTADYYRKKTDDLLVSRPVTSTSGISSVWDNVGSIENRGFEFGLNTVNLIDDGQGLGWETSFNISTNKNKVLELYRGESFNTGLDGINRVEEGLPLGAFHALRFDGVDPATGNAIFFDKDENGLINADDRVIVGNPHPDFWGGLGNTLTFRGLDLRAFVQFSQGNEIYNAVRSFADDGGYSMDNKVASVLNSWKQPGDITDVPRASWFGESGARETSSRIVEDGSYVRLQEVTLGYRLPASIRTLGGLSEARIFVSGRNLYTWTDYTGYNPDVNSNGSGTNTSLATDFYAYPLARTFSFGITGSW
jgi:TonB-linked SusC/RagA family outer membrane protein